MNKLFTKIAALVLGMTMAVGVGVAVGSGVKASEVNAASDTLAMSDLSSSDSNISAVAAKSTGNNAPITATVNNNDGVRMYANNTLTITSSQDITSLTIPWYKNGSKTFASVSVESGGGTYTHASGSGKSGTWTGSSKEIVLKIGSSGQIQLYQIQYETASAGQTFTITFDANGGTGSVPTSLEGSGNVSLPKSANLTRDGYIVNGWADNDHKADGGVAQYALGGAYDLQADVTLYAHWIQSLNVTYSSGEHSSSEDHVVSVASGSSHALISYADAGFVADSGWKFKAWSINSVERAVGYEITVNAAVTVTAVYEEDTGGELISWSRSGTTDSYTSGYTFVPQAESKTGYYQDGSGTVRSLTLYRSSSPIIGSAPSTISITAKLGGGTTKDLENPVYACFVDNSGNDIANTSVILTSSISTTTGSDFEAYLSASSATSAYGVKVYHTKESGYNVRYYSFSVAYSTETTYTITYDSNEGEGTMSPTIGTSPAVAACTFTREGYEFARWNTQADGEGTDYAVGTTVTTDITLYAIWQEKIEPIGGNVTMSGETSASLATVNGHDAIKCGTSSAAGAMTLTLQQANITKIKVYIAAWKGEGNKTVSVTIDNEATISANSITLTADSGITNSSPFTLDGEETDYKFEFTISANAPVGTVITITADTAKNNRFVVWGATDLFAEAFADEFLTNLKCDSSGNKEPTFNDDYSWAVFEGAYKGLDAEEQGKLHDAQAIESGSQIQQAMARYDYIEGKYNPTGSSTSAWKNFIGRSITPVGNGRIFIDTIIGESGNAIAIVVIVSVVSLTAIGGYFFLRKKREQN